MPFLRFLRGFGEKNGRKVVLELGLDTSFDGASINFLESVSMVPLSTFVETFAKFAQISLKKKGRGVSEGPRREKNSEKSQNTTPF